MSEQNFKSSLGQVQDLTRKAAQRVDELVFSYGHIEIDSPERKHLETKVKEILSDWADMVWECGALPQELWTVVFHTPEGMYRWQYPCSQLIEKVENKATNI